MVLKGGDRVDSVCSTAITETAYLPRGLSFVDHEAVEHQKLRARWLAWERARSAPPSDCEPPEPEKPKTRLRRLTNRLKAKFRISPEEVAAVELAERILAERAEAHWEYPGVYGNLPDVLVEDCNSERMVPVYHENYGDDDVHGWSESARGTRRSYFTAPDAQAKDQ